MRSGRNSMFAVQSGTFLRKKMKLPRSHSVPLSRQAISIIEGIREVTGTSAFLFPQIRSWHRPISDGTLNAALRRLGYDKTQMTAHGFRSTASTLLNESRLWHHDAIERQLAHMEADEVRQATGPWTCPAARPAPSCP
ncbi:tyrosine-type recombinase/integrase [Bradyrhizobium diazoefficiens]